MSQLEFEFSQLLEMITQYLDNLNIYIDNLGVGNMVKKYIKIFFQINHDSWF